MTKPVRDVKPIREVKLFERGRDRQDPTLPAILEFQWPSTAIVNAPTPRSARGIVWVVFSMIAALIVAIGVIHVDQVVTARGIVISRAPTVLVQPLDTAIVRSIDVREGEEVKAGQLLARLDPTFATADFTALETQVHSLDAQVARLTAEAYNKPFHADAADPGWSLQGAIFDNRKAQFDARVQNYENKLSELSAVIARSKADQVAYQERFGVAQTIESMRKELEAKQAGSKLNSLLATDTRVEMERAFSNSEQTLLGAQRDRDALAAERESFVRGWSAEVSEQLSDARRKASDAGEALNKARLHKQLVELTSSTDAIVQSVAKVSVGSVMQSGQPFITLAPTNAPLEVEANILGRNSGFVHVGDPVAIKFDTFPFSQYGMAEGAVATISPDSFTPQSEARNPTSAVPGLVNADAYYRSRIAINRVALRSVPANFKIHSGMPVTTDIKVGRRTVLAYLFGLIAPIASEGMREP